MTTGRVMEWKMDETAKEKKRRLRNKRYPLPGDSGKTRGKFYDAVAALKSMRRATGGRRGG